jgi:ankyrin repeat protein
MNAAAEGNVNVVRVLILAGSEINALDEKGQNALFYATDSSHTAAIRLLRAHGAIETIAVNKEKTVEQ